MRKSRDVSDETKNLAVEREPFEAVVRKLLTTPPTSKAAISRKVAILGRKRVPAKTLPPT